MGYNQSPTMSTRSMRRPLFSPKRLPFHFVIVFVGGLSFFRPQVWCMARQYLCQSRIKRSIHFLGIHRIVLSFSNATVNDACHFIASSPSLRDDQIHIPGGCRRHRSGFKPNNRSLFHFCDSQMRHFFFQVILYDPPPIIALPPPPIFAALARALEDHFDRLQSLAETFKCSRLGLQFYLKIRRCLRSKNRMFNPKDGDRTRQ
jgi:hypothetical protein